jgi:hypothetical protein
MFGSRAMRCAVSGCVENIRIMTRPENGLAIINELTGPDNSQRARSGRRLGFVSRDAELILLAETIQVQPLGQVEHPLALAARWTAAGSRLWLRWIGSNQGSCLRQARKERRFSPSRLSPIKDGRRNLHPAVSVVTCRLSALHGPW